MDKDKDKNYGSDKRLWNMKNGELKSGAKKIVTP